MAILVKSMKMPTRCWDCPFYEIGHEESYCSLTKKDVARWTPTPRPDDCPLVEVEPIKHGRWTKLYKTANHKPDGDYVRYICSACGRFLDVPDYLALGVSVYYPYCHCGAKMDGGESDDSD